jgi:hypothetical protein
MPPGVKAGLLLIALHWSLFGVSAGGPELPVSELRRTKGVVGRVAASQPEPS